MAMISKGSSTLHNGRVSFCQLTITCFYYTPSFFLLCKINTLRPQLFYLLIIRFTDPLAQFFKVDGFLSPVSSIFLEIFLKHFNDYQMCSPVSKIF